MNLFAVVIVLAIVGGLVWYALAHDAKARAKAKDVVDTIRK